MPVATKKVNIFGVADTPTALTTSNYLTNDAADSLYLRRASASNTYVSDAVYSTSSGSPLLSMTLAPNPSGSGRRINLQDTGLQQLQTDLAQRAPTANPTFTGELTAQTVKVTSTGTLLMDNVSLATILQDYVRRSGTQSVRGDKDFTGKIALLGGVSTRSNIVSNATTLDSNIVGGLTQFIGTVGQPQYTVATPSPLPTREGA